MERQREGLALVNGRQLAIEDGSGARQIILVNEDDHMARRTATEAGVEGGRREYEPVEGNRLRKAVKAMNALTRELHARRGIWRFGPDRKGNVIRLKLMFFHHIVMGFA